MCGKLLKSKESFYHHRSSFCQQSGGVEVEYQILVDTSSVEAFNITKFRLWSEQSACAACIIAKLEGLEVEGAMNTNL